MGDNSSAGCRLSLVLSGLEGPRRPIFVTRANNFQGMVMSSQQRSAFTLVQLLVAAALSLVVLGVAWWLHDGGHRPAKRTPPPAELSMPTTPSAARPSTIPARQQRDHQVALMPPEAAASRDAFRTQPSPRQPNNVITPPSSATRFGGGDRDIQLSLGNPVTLTCQNADFATVANLMYDQAGVVLVLDKGARASGAVTLSVDKVSVGEVCNRIASQLQLAWQPAPGRLVFTSRVGMGVR